jgi:ferrous iron transport protein A
MTLAQTHLGRLVTVSRIGGERAFRRRLMELGLVPGTRVELKSIAPLGDPMELLVRGCSLSIRRAEAEHVEVEAPSERATAANAAVVPELGAQSAS